MPNLDRLGPALAALRKAVKPLPRQEDVGRAIWRSDNPHAKPEDEPAPQTLKNLISEIETARGASPRASTIDAYLNAIGATWLDLGMMMERLGAAGGGKPSVALQRKKLADEAEGAVDRLVHQAADEAADRAARRVMLMLREGLSEL